MSFHRHARLLGVVCTVSAAIGFSAKAILVKLAYYYPVDAVTLLALRMIFSLPFFLLMGIWSRTKPLQQRSDLKMRDWFLIIGLGILGYYVASYLDFLGLQFISAGLERLTLYLYPTMVVLLSAIFLKRRIQVRHVAALAVSYLGISIVVSDSLNFSPVQSHILMGTGLVLASALAYSIYLIGTGELVTRVGTTRFTAYAMSAACVACILQFMITHNVAALRLPYQVYVIGVAMAVFSTVMPTWLMSEGMRRIGANHAAMIGAIGPVVTIYFGAIFLGEPITVVQIVGTCLVLIGVLMVSIKKSEAISV